MGAVLHMPETLSLAIHALGRLAREPGRTMRAADMADRIGCSLPNLIRSLQMLRRHGIIESGKGPGGGYVLQRDPASVTLLEVHEAVDGPLRSPGCGVRGCRLNPCHLCWFAQHITDVFREHLSKRTLAELACDDHSRNEVILTITMKNHREDVNEE